MLQRVLSWLPILSVALSSASAAQEPTCLPFSPGERAEYRALIGGREAGEGVLEVAGVETMDGAPTYRVRLEFTGRASVGRVRERLESWIDAQGIFSRRYDKFQSGLLFRRSESYRFDPERRTFTRLDSGERGEIPTDRPLDQLSVIFFARTLPLARGDSISTSRYYRASGNPVVVKVLRRETVVVPAGSFPAVVVQVFIRGSGLFGNADQSVVYFSDDSHRIPLKVQGRAALLGSLTLELRALRRGAPCEAGRADRTPGTRRPGGDLGGAGWSPPRPGTGP